jgi:NADH-quinone oxidoreductase subunit D/NADH-quinone oxidoreductase subunit C/D
MYTQTDIVSDVNTATGEFVINVGPQHPATHGVLHLVITLNGETIKKLIHTSVIFIAP